MMDCRERALLTVDLEDYRRQELRDALGGDPPANPREVEAQLEILLRTFAELGARATFFSVGRLTRELRSSVWQDIVTRHELGCHGDEHERVWQQTEARFKQDLLRAKSSLEERAGVAVRSYRAPYFSSDGCDPWFGATLAEAGFSFDSSRRIGAPSEGFSGMLELPGSDRRVQEVPLPSVGIGHKRLTVIGGTYFRLLPLDACRMLLRRARRSGFIPMVYLHPYDIDPSAPALEFPRGFSHLRDHLGDSMRRWGRSTAISKLGVLAREYRFEAIESLAT